MSNFLYTVNTPLKHHSRNSYLVKEVKSKNFSMLLFNCLKEVIVKKTLILIFLLLVVSILISSCGYELPEEPEHPKEFMPWCNEVYGIILPDYPNLPKSFIGYCMASLKTGEAMGEERFCKYSVDAGYFLTVKECIDSVKSD